MLALEPIAYRRTAGANPFAATAPDLQEVRIDHATRCGIMTINGVDVAMRMPGENTADMTLADWKATAEKINEIIRAKAGPVAALPDLNGLTIDAANITINRTVIAHNAVGTADTTALFGQLQQAAKGHLVPRLPQQNNLPPAPPPQNNNNLPHPPPRQNNLPPPPVQNNLPPPPPPVVPVAYPVIANVAPATVKAIMDRVDGDVRRLKQTKAGAVFTYVDNTPNVQNRDRKMRPDAWQGFVQQLTQGRAGGNGVAVIATYALVEDQLALYNIQEIAQAQRGAVREAIRARYQQHALDACREALPAKIDDRITAHADWFNAARDDRDALIQTLAAAVIAEMAPAPVAPDPIAPVRNIVLRDILSADAVEALVAARLDERVAAEQARLDGRWFFQRERYGLPKPGMPGWVPRFGF